MERGEAAGPNHGAAAATTPSPEGDKSSRVVAGDDLEPRRGSDLTCMMTAASKYGGDAVVPLEVDEEIDEAEEKTPGGHPTVGENTDNCHASLVG